MKTLLCSLMMIAAMSGAALADHTGIAGEYVCSGPECGVRNELDTITVIEGPIPLAICDSPTAGQSVGIFTSANVFTCYGSAVADSDGVYFRLAGLHWRRVRPFVKTIQNGR